MNRLVFALCALVLSGDVRAKDAEPTLLRDSRGKSYTVWDQGGGVVTVVPQGQQKRSDPPRTFQVDRDAGQPPITRVYELTPPPPKKEKK